MKQRFVFIALLLAFLNCKAQQNIRFRNVSQAGLLAGSSNTAWQWQTINGIGYKTYSVGLGIGMDDYYFKTLPAFVDLRKNLFETNHTPFAYLDLGSNIPWKKKDVPNSWQTSVFHKGFYFDAGFGYSWKIKGAMAFLISAGYSEKYVHETRTNNTINENTFPEHYDYTLRRVSMKAGLRF